MNNRNIGYDYIRIVACFMVIVNHTISTTIFRLSEGYSNTAFIGDFIFNACRMNVVSFFLISGALLLKKNETYKEWFIKRVLRILAVIFVFSAIYYDWTDGSFLGYLRSIFENNATNAFWYLYLYLGMMLALPLLRKMCSNMQQKDFILLIFLFLGTQSIHPILVHYFNFPNFQYMFSGMFSYWGSWYCIFIMGYFVDDFIAKHSIGMKTIPLLIVGWFVGNLIPTFITYRDMYYLNDTSLFMDNPFLIWSIVATMCGNAILIFVSQKLSKFCCINEIIKNISGLTFGIYLFGDKLISIVYKYFTFWTINEVIKIIVLDILIFTIGALITKLLKYVPLIRKLL